MPKHRIIGALVTAVCTLGVLAPAASASARSSAIEVNTSATAREATGRSCAVNIDTGRQECAATRQAARLKVSGPTSHLYLLARFYENINYNREIAGATLSIYGEYDCTTTTADKDHTRGDLSALYLPYPRNNTTWNNRISSFTTPASTCVVKLYSGYHGAGYYTGFRSEAYDLRDYSFNDVASSLRLT